MNKKHEAFKELGKAKVGSLDLTKCRQLSPYVSLVGTLHSCKWSYAKIVDRERVKSGKVVGYRFKTTKPIKDIITFEITDGTKAFSTDPKAYKRTGLRSVKANEEFDLNLFETMVFFMRDDIMGKISGNGFDIIIFTRSTKQDFTTAGLQASGKSGSVKNNEIYIDEKTDNGLVPLDGFEQYRILYKHGYNRRVNADAEDTQAINVLSLRESLSADLWQ